MGTVLFCFGEPGIGTNVKNGRHRMTFEELCLDPRILRAVTEMGFEQASPIDRKSVV